MYTVAKIYIINLKKRKDRLKKMTKIMNDNNIEFNIFMAVDGRQIHIRDKSLNRFKNNKFNWHPGVIGCALSHYALWQQLIHDNDDYYVVFEDDITVCDNFKEKLNRTLGEIKNKKHDIVFLGYNKYSHDHACEPDIYDPNKMIYEYKTDYRYGGVGLYGYIIGKDAAKTIHEHILNNGLQIEIDNFIIHSGLNYKLYHVYPKLVATKIANKTHRDTDIQYSSPSIFVTNRDIKQ
jgi:GR25 family glycosyltransferase involved in LPS biosynthesis